VFVFTEKRLVHSKTTLKLEKSPQALLVISPNHGRVQYKWEWKRAYMTDWKAVDVPSWTCLLYIDSSTGAQLKTPLFCSMCKVCANTCQ
jgi:hypothetical protein